MRIIDCSPYNGDTIALFRLAYLYDLVDEFVLVEARETFSGKAKEQLWLDRNAESLRPYAPKITRLVIDRFPQPSEAALQDLRRRPYVVDPFVWFREVYQRNYPAHYLRERRQDGPWILMSCDIDEIPRRELVAQLRAKYEQLDRMMRLEMTFHYYSSRWVKRFACDQAIVINDRGLEAAGCSLDTLRRDVRTGWFCKNAGWHLSYFMTDQEIARKVVSFSHQELNNERTRSEDWVRDCVMTGRDLFGRGGYEDCVPYNGTDLPDGLLQFQTAHGIGRA